MDIIGAGILIRNPKGKILVTLRKPFVSEPNRWGVPGGVNKPPDTTLQTAIKKTSREVNLKFTEKDLSFLSKFSYLSEGNNVIFSIWIAEVPEENLKININTDGHSGYMWEDPNKLLKREDLMVGMYPILKKYLEGSPTLQS